MTRKLRSAAARAINVASRQIAHLARWAAPKEVQFLHLVHICIDFIRLRFLCHPDIDRQGAEATQSADIWCGLRYRGLSHDAQRTAALMRRYCFQGSHELCAQADVPHWEGHGVKLITQKLQAGNGLIKGTASHVAKRNPQASRPSRL